MFQRLSNLKQKAKADFVQGPDAKTFLAKDVIRLCLAIEWLLERIESDLETNRSMMRVEDFLSGKHDSKP